MTANTLHLEHSKDFMLRNLGFIQLGRQAKKLIGCGIISVQSHYLSSVYTFQDLLEFRLDGLRSEYEGRCCGRCCPSERWVPIV